jgi:hypothetical protein
MQTEQSMDRIIKKKYILFLEMNKILISKSRCCDNVGPGIPIPKNCRDFRDPGIVRIELAILGMQIQLFAAILPVYVNNG